ncbi:MAG: hypothetical protein ACKVWV_20340 [Planctomycetota bacterium]
MAPVEIKRRAWRALASPLLVVFVGLVVIGCDMLRAVERPREVDVVLSAIEEMRMSLSEGVLALAQSSSAPGLTAVEMNALIAQFASQSAEAIKAAVEKATTSPPPGESSSKEDWLVYLLGLYLAGDKAYQMHKAKRAQSASIGAMLEAPRAPQ